MATAAPNVPSCDGGGALSRLPSHPRLVCVASGTVQPLCEWNEKAGSPELRLWQVTWRPGRQPDDRELVTCGGRLIQRWRWVPGEPELQRLPHGPNTFDRHSKSIRRLAFDLTGNLMAAASFDSTVSIWRFTDDDHKKQPQQQTSPIVGGPSAVTARDDPDRKASEPGGGDDTDTQRQCSCECVAVLEGHESEVKGVSVSPHRGHSGLLLATCGRDRSVWIYAQADPKSLTTGTNLKQTTDSASSVGEFFCLSVMSHHTQDVKNVRFNPTQSMLVSVSYDGSAKVYVPQSDEEGDDWQLSLSLEDHTSTVWDLAFSPDGTMLATAGADGTVYIYAESSNGAIGNLPYIASKSILGTALKFSTMKRARPKWRMTGELDLSSELHELPIYSIDWTTIPIGSTAVDVIALGSGDHSIRLFYKTRQRGADENQEAAWTDGVEGATSGTQLMHSHTWTHLITQEAAHDTDVNCVQFYHVQDAVAGSAQACIRLASCSDDGMVKVWEFRDPLFFSRGD